MGRSRARGEPASTEGHGQAPAGRPWARKLHKGPPEAGGRPPAGQQQDQAPARVERRGQEPSWGPRGGAAIN